MLTNLILCVLLQVCVVCHVVVVAAINVLFVCAMLFREHLDDPAVLCSAPHITAELKRWLHAFEVYRARMQAVESEYSRMVSDPTPPTPLSPIVSTYVCYIVTVCAEMAVYSGMQNRSNEVPIPENTPNLPSCDATHSSQLHDPTLVSHGASMSVSSLCITSTPERSCDLATPSSVLCDLATPNSVSCDLATPSSVSCDSLDMFIQLYFDHLDLARILHLLNQQNWDVRQTCWKVLVAKLAERPTSAANVMGWLPVSDHSDVNLLLTLLK